MEMAILSIKESTQEARVAAQVRVQDAHGHVEPKGGGTTTQWSSEHWWPRALAAKHEGSRRQRKLGN